MDNMVICCPVTAEACIPYQVSLCWIFGGYTSTGTGLFRGTLASIYYYSTNPAYIFI